MISSPTVNRSPATTPINVTLQNDEKIQTSDECDLNIKSLLAKARTAHVVPGLNSHSLISVVKLCNAGCEVTFTRTGCIVKYRGSTVLEGHKCTRTGLSMDGTIKPKQLTKEHFKGGYRNSHHTYKPKCAGRSIKHRWNEQQRRVSYVLSPTGGISTKINADKGHPKRPTKILSRNNISEWPHTKDTWYGSGREHGQPRINSLKFWMPENR